ncbi:hypothetical protein C8R45DRAFT_1038812 [Mycena sanguinolenta]|nr:hypothetical protein C8R45DRAFT_1038812 [Mycena sanguinolenta]
MDAASDIDVLPPTTHEIPRPARLRMMRSMRKLTAVLGETPVVETQLLAPNSGKRGFFFHASASLSSLALPLRKSDAPPAQEPRPSLVLRVPETFEPLPSPLSPGFTPSLMSPTSPEEEPDRRRLHLAKVSRILGENVPPELILPDASIKRRRRASTLIMPESALEHQNFIAALTGASVADPELRGTRRPVLETVRNALSFILPNDAPSPVNDAAVVADEALGEVHVHPVLNSLPDSMSPQAEGSWLRPTLNAILSVPDTDPEPVAFASLGSDEAHPRPDSRHSYAIPPPSAMEGAMQRHEEEWVGEWGGAAGNMEDVMRRLRELKVK